MYVLLCGCFPFFGNTSEEIFNEIKAAKVTGLTFIINRLLFGKNNGKEFHQKQQI
jgi:hypothetical protein